MDNKKLIYGVDDFEDQFLKNRSTDKNISELASRINSIGLSISEIMDILPMLSSALEKIESAVKKHEIDILSLKNKDSDYGQGHVGPSPGEAKSNTGYVHEIIK